MPNFTHFQMYLVFLTLSIGLGCKPAHPAAGKNVGELSTLVAEESGSLEYLLRALDVPHCDSPDDPIHLESLTEGTSQDTLPMEAVIEIMPQLKPCPNVDINGTAQDPAPDIAGPSGNGLRLAPLVNYQSAVQTGTTVLRFVRAGEGAAPELRALQVLKVLPKARSAKVIKLSPGKSRGFLGDLANLLKPKAYPHSTTQNDLINFLSSKKIYTNVRGKTLEVHSFSTSNGLTDNSFFEVKCGFGRTDCENIARWILEKLSKSTNVTKKLDVLQTNGNWSAYLPTAPEDVEMLGGSATSIQFAFRGSLRLMIEHIIRSLGMRG